MTAEVNVAQQVTLIVPPLASMARVVRLTASSIASLGDMTVDEIDDIKIAVSELMTMLIQHENPSAITLRFEAGDEDFGIEAVMAVSASDLEGPDALLAKAVLEAVCDTYEVETGDGTIRARVVKRRAGDRAHSNS